MQDFRDLKVWEKSHCLALAVYRATAEFPREESYGLTSQMRRAAVSIPANIAEGCGRSGGPDMARYLQIAAGSANELEYLLMLAHDLDLVDAGQSRRLGGDVAETRRMLASLIQKVRGGRQPRSAEK